MSGSSTSEGGREDVALSVIIPCYNAAGTLGEQLDALSKQHIDQPWEVIVVDNRSTDDPGAVVDRFRDRLDVRLIAAAEDQGCAYARNVGAAQANGKLLLFCDADDVVAPKWLEIMYEALQQHSFVTGPVDPAALNNYVRPKRLRSEVRRWDYMPFLPHAIGGNMGVWRELHEAVGGFDPTMKSAEDLDYSWRLQLEQGAEIHFVQDAVIYYRFRETLAQAFWQNVHNGEYTALLYKKFQGRKGMPRKTLKDGAREWYRLLRQARYARDQESRARWMRHFGLAAGRLKGSIKYRTLAL